MKWLLSGLTLLVIPLTGVMAQVPAPSSPPVTIALGSRHGHVTPIRQGFTHTGGGNIDVAQPAPDTLVVTMSGVAVAGAHPCKDSVAGQDFELEQSIEIAADKPQGKAFKLTLEARVVGLLRSHRKGGGMAEESGVATLVSGANVLATVSAPAHAVSAGENLSINDREGPTSAAIAPGKYTLHQTFHITARHAHTLVPCKAASAEFAPDPALDPLWISFWEPFHGANKKDFGFQVTIKVATD
jgi:hypothetical protein